MGDRNVTRTRLRSGNTRDRRSEDSRLSETAVLKSAGSATPSNSRSPSEDVAALDRDLVCEHIRHVIGGLRDAMYVVVTAVEALRHQNADHDEEFAQVLRRHASDRLDAEIEQLEVLISVLDPRKADEELGIAGDEGDEDQEDAALAA